MRADVLGCLGFNSNATLVLNLVGTGEVLVKKQGLSVSIKEACMKL